jgi:hypothetical protein
MPDATVVVTAFATVGLFAVAATQIILHIREGRRRRGRLEAVATYYAMLVQRSIEQTLRELDDLRGVAREVWWEKKAMQLSAALGGEVAANLEQLATAWIERHGRTGAALQRIIRQFYDAAHEINALAAGRWAKDLESRQQALDSAQKRFDATLISLRDEFDLPRKALPPDSTS